MKLTKATRSPYLRGCFYGDTKNRHGQYDRRTIKIHKIAALVFLGPPPRDENDALYEVHHIDGNPRNNAASNLIYLSHAEHYAYHEMERRLSSPQNIEDMVEDPYGPDYDPHGDGIPF
jgi:hypothetical protein